MTGSRPQYRSRTAAPSRARHSASALSRYRVVVAPSLRLIDEALAAGLAACARTGGVLVASPLLATLDRDHVAPPDLPPYLLRDLFGVEHVEWSSLGPPVALPKELHGKDGHVWDSGRDGGRCAVHSVPEHGLSGNYTAHTWIDHLRPTGARALAVLESASPAGAAPAVTLHEVAAGRAVYVAAVLDQRLYDDLMALLVDGAPCPVRPVDDEARVEVIPCRSGDTGVYVVLNHEATSRTVAVAGRFRELLGDMSVTDILDLPGYGVAVLSAMT